jgi:hypothetical protein
MNIKYLDLASSNDTVIGLMEKNQIGSVNQI